MAPAKSDHLNRIVKEQYGSASLQVVFLDVVGYSKRKSTTQRLVIEHFTSLLKQTQLAVSQKYTDYAQSRGVNFSTDIIRIPTGDGAALAFSFDGLPAIALDFGSEFLSQLNRSNSKVPCDKFIDQGWCNCHHSFQIRIGIAEGRGIVYVDINENFNVAGTTINMAARVMGLAEPMQIFFTDEAYRSLIDMTTDISLESKFRQIENVVIKHGKNISVFQYADDTVKGLSTAVPEGLIFNRRARELMSKMGFAGETSTEFDPETVAGRARLEAMMSAVENLWSMFGANKEPFGDVLASKPEGKVITSEHTVIASGKQEEKEADKKRSS